MLNNLPGTSFDIDLKNEIVVYQEESTKISFDYSVLSEMGVDFYLIDLIDSMVNTANEVMKAADYRTVRCTYDIYVIPMKIKEVEC